MVFKGRKKNKSRKAFDAGNRWSHRTRQKEARAVKRVSGGAPVRPGAGGRHWAAFLRKKSKTMQTHFSKKI